MAATFRVCRRIVPWLVLCLCSPLLTAQAVQDQPNQPAPGQRRQRGPGGGRGPADLVRRLFQAAPEDQGPLKPGEADELLAFAEQHAPRVYQLMHGLQQRDPARFREKMAAHAPRLRHLRRIYELNPQMGAIIQAYADDLVAIERSARALRASRSGPPDSPEYSSDLEKLRSLVAGNVRRECDALDLVADQFERERAARIDRRFAYLTGDAADLAAEPADLQRLIAAFRDAPAEPARAKLHEQIQAAVARQIDAEVAALRARATRLREDMTTEVDRRVKQALESPGRRGPHHGPPQ
jgi:hypothetical protein